MHTCSRKGEWNNINSQIRSLIDRGGREGGGDERMREEQRKNFENEKRKKGGVKV